MPGIIVVGTQWGDEGKGKIVDLLSEKADVVVRYQGGHNAGHTVVMDDETYVLHIVPSGILHKHCVCIIGSGVVVDAGALLEELDHLRARQIPIDGRVRIGAGAHLIMPYHKVIEKESEKQKGARRIGTTGRGIGPAYVDKMARIGIRVGDLLDLSVFREKLQANLSEMNYLLEHLYQAARLNLDQIYTQYVEYASRLKEMIADTSFLVNEALNQEKHVLFEGAQGTHLDIDHGTYPFVTSSSAVAGGACTGIGVGPTRISSVLGVVKVYATRVGQGPFPTELNDTTGAMLQERGHEFGSTTGRPRRCGWFDAVAVRYSVRINGISGLAVTKLDVLDEYDTIKICTGYRQNGQTISEMPLDSFRLSQCEPIYEEIRGWKTSTTGVTSFQDLPELAKAYLQRIEDLLESKIRMISTGSQRNHTITVSDPYGTL